MTKRIHKNPQIFQIAFIIELVMQHINSSCLSFFILKNLTIFNRHKFTERVVGLLI